MAQLFDIRKVTVGPRALVARVEIAPSAPLMTGDDPEGTERVLSLMPGLADHVCLGDASASFGEVVSDTELAHLLEHVTVGLLAQTNIAGDISSGQTVEVAERAYEITLSCPDDVLVAGALSSAAWVMQWAYSGGGAPEPDIAAIAQGLADLVQSLAEKDEAGQPAEEQREDAPEPVAPAPAAEAPEADEPEPAEPLAVPEAAPELQEPVAEEPQAPVAGSDYDSAELPVADEPASAQDEEPPSIPSAWDMDNVPRPHLVR